MHFPKYWVWSETELADSGGRPKKFAAWGWSDVSKEDARQVGIQRAQRAAEWVRENDARISDMIEGRKVSSAQTNWDYEYVSTRPFREEILDTLSDGDAIVSRNRYGAEILNTSRLAFVDIDYPYIPEKRTRPARSGILGFLFPKPATPAGPDWKTEVLQVKED